MVDHGLPILSSREKQLLRRIAKGKSNHRIAVEIGGTEQQGYPSSEYRQKRQSRKSRTDLPLGQLDPQAF